MRLIGLAVALIVGLMIVPLVGEAQQTGKVYKIGWIGGFPPDVQMKARPAVIVNWRAFTDGLRDLGWVENQNFVFVRRYSENRPERYSRLAAELVALKPDIIVSGIGEPAIRALKVATARASVAAHSRRARSVKAGASVLYFARQTLTFTHAAYRLGLDFCAFIVCHFLSVGSKYRRLRSLSRGSEKILSHVFAMLRKS